MPRGEDWSRIEVEACTADYVRMLTLELNGQHYSKAEHARALLELLDGRSRQSVEFKHCNISAAMIELGYPYIAGYKPRGNYQALLFETVEVQCAGSYALQEAAQAAAMRPAAVLLPMNIDNVWVAVPSGKAKRIGDEPPTYAPNFSARRRDYIAQEARNRSLGGAGELFVVDIETRRLHAAGKRALSERVEHIAASRGDGAGFDVLSFETDGRERLIEVKTTAFGELTPFFVSRNELARSKADAELYHLYRVFDFRGQPRVFDMPGEIRRHCTLEEVSYLARVII